MNGNIQRVTGRRLAAVVAIVAAVMIVTLVVQRRLQAAVQLSEFSATYTVEGNVRINWKTVAETDTVGYYVMRATSENGFPAPALRDFIDVRPEGSDDQVKFIPGSGGQIGSFEYTVFDEDPSLVVGQRYWYKLVEEERDGRLETYSNGVDDMVFGTTTVADPVLTPGTLVGGARPGATQAYSLTLTNLGNEADVFRITVEDASWPTSSQPPLLVSQMPAGSSRTIQIFVTVPVDAAPNSVDTIVVRVQSLDIDQEVSATAAIVTFARYAAYMPTVYRQEAGE